MAYDAIRNPFGRTLPTRAEQGTSEVQESRQEPKVSGFVIQRREDDRYLDAQRKPVKDHADAEIFESEPLAKLWAIRAQSQHSGTWAAVPAPATHDTDDFPAAAA